MVDRLLLMVLQTPWCCQPSIRVPKLPRSGRFGSAAVRISSQDAQQEQVGNHRSPCDRSLGI